METGVDFLTRVTQTGNGELVHPDVRTIECDS